MSEKLEKYTRRTARNTYIGTVVSLSLVLFILGLLGCILLSADGLADRILRNVRIDIYMADNLKKIDINQFKKKLDAEPFVFRTKKIGPDSAAAEFQRELGENFVAFIGRNPLMYKIEVQLLPGYAHPDSVEKVVQADIFTLKEHQDLIDEVRYNKTLLTTLNENIKTVSLVLMVFSGLLFLVAMVLINNTIRLTIYSRRFLIKTMQLVGATQGFIRRPFIWRGVLQGFYSALIASALLTALLYTVGIWEPMLVKALTLTRLILLFGMVALSGLLITWASTLWSVRKYLRLKSDDLY